MVRNNRSSPRTSKLIAFWLVPACSPSLNPRPDLTQSRSLEDGHVIDDSSRPSSIAACFAAESKYYL